MANNTSIRRRANYVRPSRQKRTTRKKKFRSGNIRRTKPTSSSSLKGYVASGIRTLTSFLPGQTIVRPAVDFIMKAIGLTTKYSITTEGHVMTESKILGLSTIKQLTYGDLLCSLKNFGIQVIAGDSLPATLTDFVTGRILKLKICFEPTGKTSERSGEWAVAIVPIRDATSVKRFHRQSGTAREFVSPNFESVKNIAGAQYGPATKPLCITWYPNITRDGMSAMERSLVDNKDAALCLLVLAYSQEMRAAYENFSVESFNFKTVLETSVKFGEREVLDGFQPYAGEQAVTLRPSTEKPHAIYDMTIQGKTIRLADDDPYVEINHSKSGVSFRINKDHPNIDIYRMKDLDFEMMGI